MSREEIYRAAREARSEMTEEPERERPHESALARFIAGIAYGRLPGEKEEPRENAENENAENGEAEKRPEP